MVWSVLLWTRGVFGASLVVVSVVWCVTWLAKARIVALEERGFDAGPPWLVDGVLLRRVSNDRWLFLGRGTVNWRASG